MKQFSPQRMRSLCASLVFCFSLSACSGPSVTTRLDAQVGGGDASADIAPGGSGGGQGASGGSGGGGATTAPDASATGGSGSGGAGSGGSGAGGARTGGSGPNGSGGGLGSGGAIGSGGAASGGRAGGAGSGGSAPVGTGGGAGGSAGAAAITNGLGPLPVPAGASNVPRPAGSAANLKVLPWAGFKAAVTYSFDDSQQSQVNHWADIRATGIVATYYMSSGNNGLPNYDSTWRDAVARGNELGNHTAHHCKYDLSGCIAGTGTTINAEIDDCTNYAKTKLNAPGMWTMAYPFGATGYKPDARSRFFLARGTPDGFIAANDNTDPFNLPVRAADGGETAAQFNAFINDVRSQGKWMIFLIHTIRPDSQTEHAYADIEIGTITGSIAHLKTLPDVWVDTVASVGAYWLGEKTVRAVTPTTSGGKTTWRWTLPAHFPAGRQLRVTVDGGSLSQGDTTLTWDGHGYYEIALDAGTLTWSP